MNIHLAVFEIPHAKYFLQKIKKLYHINNFEFRKKTKNILAILFVHILHITKTPHILHIIHVKKLALIATKI